MNQIRENLYQFSLAIPPMNFTIHQYLLDVTYPMLVGTGTKDFAISILKELKTILNNRDLAYIFVSHMESDECGGLDLFLQSYPNVSVICSTLCARELSGFGYRGKILPVKGGDRLNSEDFDLQIINYPAEVHLQNGIVALEQHSGIFFSSDLLLSYGMAQGCIKNVSWHDSVAKISKDRVPDEVAREALKSDLLKIHPSFAAVGHGYCLSLQ